MDCKNLLLEYFWLNKWGACVKICKKCKKIFAFVVFIVKTI